MRTDHARQVSTANKAWASILELEELGLQNEDTAKGIREETETQIKEIQASFMTVIETLNIRDSELCKLRKKEASRATSQGTSREPSAKAKVPLSYQETAEDEKTARNRAILTLNSRRSKPGKEQRTRDSGF